MLYLLYNPHDNKVLSVSDDFKNELASLGRNQDLILYSVPKFGAIHRSLFIGDNVHGYGYNAWIADNGGIVNIAPRNGVFSDNNLPPKFDALIAALANDKSHNEDITP